MQQKSLLHTTILHPTLGLLYENINTIGNIVLVVAK